MSDVPSVRESVLLLAVSMPAVVVVCVQGLPDPIGGCVADVLFSIPNVQTRLEACQVAYGKVVGTIGVALLGSPLEPFHRRLLKKWYLNYCGVHVKCITTFCSSQITILSAKSF